MDAHIKEGQLYVQHQKFGKKWKKSWFVLYPASQNGIARLEFYDCSTSSGSQPISTKKLDKKIIRLSECISILPSLEAGPKEGMATFCVETNDKTHVFAADKSVSTEWVEKMCDIAFQGGSGAGSSISDDQQNLQMAENMIYYSREEVSEFWVSVQRTEASERCGLLGTYYLRADKDSLVLRESKSRMSLLVWPYKLLRRYGRDRVMFSFEAGRRCESGPGNFTFETKQGNEIFSIVEAAIRSQKSQAEERPATSDPAQPRTAVATGTGGSGDGREADGDSGGSKPGSADGVFGGRGHNHKGRGLPEPPPPTGGKMGGSPLPRAAGEGAGVYSEPVDSVRLPAPLPPLDCLYSDPVDSLVTSDPAGSAPVPTPRLRPLGDEAAPGGRLQGNRAAGGGSSPGGSLEPLYSDLYDRVALDLMQRMGALGLEGAEPTEHIYDEPEGHGVAAAWRGRGQGEEEGTYSLAVESQTRPPAGSRWPKPTLAPKPIKMPLPRKEPAPLPLGRHGGGGGLNVNNNNSTGGGNRAEGVDG
ncbi:docking protein 1b, partial [Osmerus eperlanus]|uniref:docking protein 1b n=1 Tax=Osmerus eperlanus TaxID=29151 RepID=UPI002E14E2A9